MPGKLEIHASGSHRTNACRKSEACAVRQALQSERRSLQPSRGPRVQGQAVLQSSAAWPILVILIVATCTPARRPHDRARGTSVIAVESTDAHLLGGEAREHLFAVAESSLRRGGAAGSTALPPRPPSVSQTFR